MTDQLRSQSVKAFLCYQTLLEDEMIPKTIIEKILDAVHIEDVVAEFLPLQKRGTIYRALSIKRRQRPSRLRPIGICSTVSAVIREAMRLPS